MDQASFKLSLDVVEEAHERSKFLVQSQLWVRAVDLLPEDKEEGNDHDWTCVLDKEDSPPGDLWAKVLEVQSDIFLLDVVTKCLAFVRQGSSLGSLNSEPTPGI